VRRYFVTPQESGELCLMSCLLGENRDIFFPKLSETLDLTRFSDIAIRYLAEHGYEAYPCASEEEARIRATELIQQRKWPCYFFASDTTGEKDFEEFFTDRESLDMNRFTSIGVIRNTPVYDQTRLEAFVSKLAALQSQPSWDKAPIVDLFNYMIPDFGHKETGKYLDGRM
jgi:hypothetical protein